MKPFRLTPSLREKIWGRTDLAPWHPGDGRKVGEIWFLAEQELPILVKLLYTSEKLSVQVHPDDADGEQGKTEMWYVLRAEPGAALGLGFRQPLTRERLREASLTGEIEHLLRWIPVKPGEAYFAPAHTVHAIGAGLVLCEIQQNADTTYRLYDYGRPRDLHLERAVELADLGPHPGASVPDGRVLVRSPHFVTEEFRGPETFAGAGRPEWLVAVEGRGTIAGMPFCQGEVWLIPPAAPEFRIEGDARWLRTWKP
ncbi:MAG: type I phosphomannose isomerase catalytic subunit [Bryobacteraceae bacterium]